MAEPDVDATLRPSPHPALAGRERQMADLSDEVRRLILLSVSCDLPADEAEAAVRELKALNERIATRVPAEPLPRFWAPTETPGEPAEDERGPDGVASPAGTWDASTITDSMPYDVVMGRYNPLAPPLVIDLEPPKATAVARFSPAYEGAPGWVHGAAIAGAFDIVLTAANHLEAAAGPTTRLEVRYRRPTLLAEEARFEAWVERRDGRRVLSKGHLLQGGVVKVEARGEFVSLNTRGRAAMRGGEPRTRDD